MICWVALRSIYSADRVLVLNKAYIRLEADKWSAVVKKAGIRID